MTPHCSDLTLSLCGSKGASSAYYFCLFSNNHFAVVLASGSMYSRGQGRGTIGVALLSASVLVEPCSRAGQGSVFLLSLFALGYQVMF